MFSSVLHLPDPVTGAEYDGSNDPLVLTEVREYLDAFMPVALCRMDVSVGMLNIIVGSESGDETFILTAHRMFSPHGSDIPFISICGDPHPDRRNSRDCARMLVLADSRFIKTVLEFGRLVAARHWGCDDGGRSGDTPRSASRIRPRKINERYGNHVG